MTVVVAMVVGLFGATLGAAQAVEGTGIVEGTVVDIDGNPLNGYPVGLAAAGDTEPSATTVTGVSPDGFDGPPGGYFRFEGVAAGEYTVLVADESGDVQVISASVVVVDGQTTTLEPYTWDAGTPGAGVVDIGGYVRGPGGHYLDGVNVEAYLDDDPDAAPVASALTYEGADNPHGYYSLEVPAGTYRIKYTPVDGSGLRSSYYPRLVEVSDYGEDLDTVTLRSVDGPGFTGLVTGPGGDAVPFPRVVVFRRVRSHGWSDGVVSMGARDGSFSVPAHPGSVVTVRVSSPGYNSMTLGGGSALPAELTPDNSRVVGSGPEDLGTFSLSRSLGANAGQDFPYCDRHVLPANDDGSTRAVALPFGLSFFGQDYDHLYVNNNGNVTFDGSLSQYTPSDLTGDTGMPIIAPFFADVDTRGRDSLETTYGVSPDGQSLCVNWTQVGYYASHSDKLNTFQLVLTKATGEGRVDGDFDITFNYDHVQWETGDASGGDGGTGGTSAAAGFSAGTGIPGTFVQLPGSFVNGALLDGGANALVSGFQGSITPGRYVFPVRNSGVSDTLGGLVGEVRSGTVAGAPVVHAYVQACRATGSFCRTTTTAGDGSFAFTALPAGSYTISVSPPDGSSLFPGSGSGEVVAGSDSTVDPIVLQAPRPMPSGVSITNADPDSGLIDPYVPESGPPVVHYMADLIIAFDGCPNVADPEVTEYVDGQLQHGGPIALTEGPDGHYTATIPAVYPAHGDGSIVTNVPVACDGDPVAFDIYVDPSGVVTDQYGRPLSGATVTLRRADTEAGPYVDVPDGSAVMSPSNRTNPDQTDGAGFFRWDVLAGWYKVSSQSAGCDDVATPAMEVPPARLDLLVKMTCTAGMPSPTTAPVLSGTAQVGQTLSVTQGAWPAGLVLQKVEWLRGATVVGTGLTYSPTGADQGQRITARVYAKRPDYSQAGAGLPDVSFTPATADVQSDVIAAAPGGVPAAPVNTVAPTIGGIAKVGRTLTVEPGTWDTAGLLFTYQWRRGGQPISGATDADYSPTAADVGKELTVRVLASKAGLPGGAATSQPVTVALGDAPAALAPPAITGDVAVGEPLQVSTGTWDASGLSFGYQWLRDGAPVDGATDATYTVVDADQGHDLSAVVTATKDGYADGTAEADPVAVPEQAPERVASTTTARLTRNVIQAGRHGHLRVTVTRADGQPVVGPVQVRADGHVVRTRQISGATHGRRTFTLPKLDVGRHRIVAVYLGDGLVDGSRSTVVRLRVHRKHRHHHQRIALPAMRMPSIF